MSWRLTALCAALIALGVAGAPVEPAEAAPRWTLESRFAREVVRPGDVDEGVYAIEHVREVKYRLSWLGHYNGKIDGVWGPVLTAAVKEFQRDRGIKASGVVNYRTWKRLIPRTVRGRWAIPQACRTTGWHACYDRFRHQVTLWRDGRVHNAWLVRGGAYDSKTRVGDFTVYRRSEHHKSSLYDDAPMPYAQFFSGGQALHGSTYMIDPFEGHSHGCVNMYIEDARQLWRLTSDKTLRVHVYGRWD